MQSQEARRPRPGVGTFQLWADEYQSHKPPGAHVAQRPPKGPRWARRCGEACRCAGGCWSDNCCMGQWPCSRGFTVHGERHYCWQCFGPERASICVEGQHEICLYQAPPCYTFSKARRSDKVGPVHSSSVEAQHGPFTFENERANENEGQREREVLEVAGGGGRPDALWSL